MKDLKYYQNIIKERRKKTDFRDFLKEIASWYPIVFHKNNGLISRHPENNRIGGVLKSIDFEVEREKLCKTGLKYDFSKSFFDNFSLILSSTNLSALIQFPEMNENSEYGDIIFGAKNSYLNIVNILNIENTAYNFFVKNNCKNIFNSFFIINNSENIYFSKSINSSRDIFYSKYINNSYCIYFSSNLTGCKNCLFCNDLENKEYYINNIKYSKEKFQKEKNKVLQEKNNFLNFYKNVDDIGKSHGSENTTGNYNLYCQNLEKGFNCNRVQNGKNNIMIYSEENISTNMYDVLSAGTQDNNNFYGIMGAGMGSNNLYCSSEITESYNIFYSYQLRACSYCIGCVGLKNKSYCILNKQYTKENWNGIVIQIFDSMEKDGILGDFFPGNLNPFYFNDTIAGIIGGFKKENIIKDGYLWRDNKIKTDIPKGIEIINIYDLDKYEGFDEKGKWYIDDKILKVVIKDEEGNYYKVINLEYDFLLKYGLPIPRLHWLDRIKLNLT